MRGPDAFISKTVLCILIFSCYLLLTGLPAHGASLSLLTDLEYEVINSTTTDKATQVTSDTERATFSQLYNLEVKKEIFPTLQLSFGGLFDEDSTRTETNDPDGQDSKTRNTAIRPFFDLQFATDLIQAAAGYRKSELKRNSSTSVPRTDRIFTEEYSARVNWDPVDLPEVDLYFTRNLAWNEPLTNDQQVDTYQLRSRYERGAYRFNFNHTTNDAINKTADFKTLTNFDEGVVRFSRNYQKGKYSVNSSLRANRQEIEFSGIGDRFVTTTSAGSVIGNSDDVMPMTSDPEDGFALSSIDLLVDSLLEANQLSFGLDFGADTRVDRLLINISDLGNASSGDFPWAVYVRDNETENWQPVAGVVATTDFAEQQFEISFNTVETRFIKIVTTPLAPPVVSAGQDLLISSLVPERALPPDTSVFTTTDVTGDLFFNWRLTDKTTTGYDFIYREQRTQPFDEKKTLLSIGGRLRHVFNDVYNGTMRVQRSESRERGENPVTNYSYSAALAAKYLDTFDQSLTYSFSYQNDEDSRTDISNAIFLRSNLELYEGWSMFLDNGYSWQNPAEGAGTNTTFLRVGSNIVPNRWLNLTLNYGISWARETGKQVNVDQNSRLVVTLVPTSSLSFSADLQFSDEEGESNDSTAEQQYFVNWSPFRDGNLFFSLGYGQSENDDDEKTWSLSPTLRWQINRKTLLTLDYAIGERDDSTEVIEFENISLALRFFY